MDEKKQIEEIYDIIADCCNNKSGDECIETINCDECKAISLYNAGLRNCKDKVVLTKEEHSDYLILQQNHEFIKEKAKELQADNERLYKNLGKFKDSVRKETAREIYNKAKEYDSNFDMTSLGEYIIANLLTEENIVKVKK